MKEKNARTNGYKLLPRLHHGALHTVTPTMSFLAQRTLNTFTVRPESPWRPGNELVAETTGSGYRVHALGGFPIPRRSSRGPRTSPLPRKSFAVQWSGVPLGIIEQPRPCSDVDSRHIARFASARILQLIIIISLNVQF